MIVDNENNRHGTKREVLKPNGSGTFRNMMIQDATVRTNETIEGRFKINIHSHNSISIVFLRMQLLESGNGTKL